VETYKRRKRMRKKRRRRHDDRTVNCTEEGQAELTGRGRGGYRE